MVQVSLYKKRLEGYVGNTFRIFEWISILDVFVSFVIKTGISIESKYVLDVDSPYIFEFDCST